MKVFASSGTELLGEFLHPGYGQSPGWKPEPLYPYMIPVASKPTLAVDLHRALELAPPAEQASSDAAAQARPAQGDRSTDGSPDANRTGPGERADEGEAGTIDGQQTVAAPDSSWTETLQCLPPSIVVSVATSLALAGLLLLPRRKGRGATALGVASTLALGLGCAVGISNTSPIAASSPDAPSSPVPSQPPTDDSAPSPTDNAAPPPTAGPPPPPAASAVRSTQPAGIAPEPPAPPFVRPREATQAILWGLLYDGLICTPTKKNYAEPVRLESIDVLRDELAFPVHPLTPGMARALQNPHLDGWGRPFVFESQSTREYRITSVGEDGDLGSPDDLVLAVKKPVDPSWTHDRRAFFVQERDDQLQVLYHRHRFEMTWWNVGFHHRTRARELTQTDLFDVIDEHQFTSRQQVALRSRFDDSHVAPNATLLLFYPRENIKGPHRLGYIPGGRMRGYPAR